MSYANEKITIPYYYKYSGALNGSLNGNVFLGPYPRVGTSLPMFRDLIAKHLGATTGYSRQGLDHYSTAKLLAWDASPVYDANRRVLRYDETHGSAVCFPPNIEPFSIPFDQVLYDQVAGKIRNKIAKALPEFESLVPIGEIREVRSTLRGITYASTNMLQAMLALKQRRVKDAWKYASDIWLTYSFGVSPTMSDLDGLLAQVADKLYTTYPANITVGATASKAWSSRSATAASSNVSGRRSVSCYPVYYHTLSYHVSAGLKPSIAAGNIYRPQGDFGLSATHIVPALWNLTPYSWLVDYFTTMGNFLDDTFIGTPGNTVYCSMSQKYTRQMFASYSANPPSAVVGNSSVSGKFIASATQFSFTRTSLPAIPARSLRFKTADEIGQNAVNRMLNLGALLAGAPPRH